MREDDAKIGLRDNADNNAGAGAGKRHAERVPRAVVEGFDDVLERAINARRFAECGNREASGGAGQRGERRAEARIHHDENDNDRNEEVATFGHHDRKFRQFRTRHAHDAVTLCFEMHGAEAGDVIEDRRDESPR